MLTLLRLLHPLRRADLELHGEHWPHVHLNPPDDERLLENSALVLVASTGNIRPLGWEPQVWLGVDVRAGTGVRGPGVKGRERGALGEGGLEWEQPWRLPHASGKVVQVQ